MSLPRPAKQSKTDRSINAKKLTNEIKKSFDDNIDIHKSGLFGHTLWLMVMKQGLIHEAVKGALPSFLSPGLVRIILDYQFLDSTCLTLNTRQSTGQIIKTFMTQNQDCMDLMLTFKRDKGNEEFSEPVNAMTKLLNCISPPTLCTNKPILPNKIKKAQANDPGDSKDDVRANCYSYVITAPNSLWVHPELLKEVKETQKNYSQAEIENFLEKSGQGIKKSSEVIAELKTLRSEFEKDKEYKTNDSSQALLTALKNYITFVEQTRLNASSLEDLKTLAGEVHIKLYPFIGTYTSGRSGTPRLITNIFGIIKYLYEVACDITKCTVTNYQLNLFHAKEVSRFKSNQVIDNADRFSISFE